MRRRRPWARIGETLRRFEERFPAEERLAADPVKLAHEHAAPADQEVAALVASCLAFGRASSVIDKARRVLEPLGDEPSRAVQRLRAGQVSAHLRDWRHRWIAGRDVAFLLAGIGRALRRHGSLRAAFVASHDAARDASSLLTPMAAFAREMEHPNASAWFGKPRLSRGARYLLPVPDGSAAAKRLCLFLRWMARPADGVDLGLWPEVSPAALTMPLDTHVARIGRYVGLTERQTPGWRMARDITRNLARFAPEDPVRFDFALSHLGIMGGCPRRRDARRCAACDLLPACRL